MTHLRRPSRRFPARIPWLFRLVLGLALGATAATRAPTFRLQDTEGRAFALQDDLGRDVIVLDFWATYCIPCLSELDALQKLQDRYRDHGVQVIAISMDQPQTAARVRALARGRGFSFPVLLDPDQQAVRLYGVSVLPTSLVIDRGGNIVYRHEGFEPGDIDALESKLPSLLSDTAAAAKSAAASGAAGPLRDLSLSGSNFLRANDGQAGPEIPNSNTWLEDWFDFRLADARLSYQARFRTYQYLREVPGSYDNLILNPTGRVVKQTFAYTGDDADITAGNFYGTLNRGLVLHAFEDRQARIDKDVKGVTASLQGGQPGQGLGRGQIAILGGNTFASFTDLYTLDAEEDSLRNTYIQGAAGSWQPRTGLTVGAQYLEAFRPSWHAKVGGGDVEWSSGPTALYLAYVGLTGRDQFNYPYAYDGHAAYASLSENLGRLELAAEAKDYYNYDLGFADPPSLVQYHTFRLMERDALFPNNQGEQGAAVRGAWHFDAGNTYAADLSDILSRPERNPSLLIYHVDLPYWDLDQTWQFSPSDRRHLQVELDWMRQREFQEGSFEDLNALTLGVSTSAPLRGPWSWQGEAEVQRRPTDLLSLLPPDAALGQLGAVGPVYDYAAPWQGVISVTLVRNSAWTFTLDYEGTTSKWQQDSSSFALRPPGITRSWASAYATCSLVPNNQISLWFGQRQQEVVCSGGMCRLEPAFDGAELIWDAHF